MRHPITRALQCCAAALALTGACGAAAAYPDHPIRIVVPVAPGGGNDIVARMLARRLSDTWGQPVVVDNRPGASTAIGSEIVAKASPEEFGKNLRADIARSSEMVRKRGIRAE